MSEAAHGTPDKRMPETIDGATGKPDPHPRRVDLSSLRDVRLELAALYRKVDAGEVDSRDGSRRAYILKTIHDVIVSAELEKRLIELEDRSALDNRARILDCPPRGRHQPQTL